ncbi:phage tail protein, partial [Salmonella enterica]|nr:phage tail protein [Salmonella enterica]EJH2877469.1 phage tail protein [Salmonella enterica]
GNYAIPFAVVDGKVVIDEAAIREATIKILNAQHIVADEIKVGATLTAPVIRSGIIDNGPFQVDSNGNLRIGSLFSISSQGQISIRNATTNIGLVIRNDRIEVYDSAGNLVVRMGRLR